MRQSASMGELDHHEKNQWDLNQNTTIFKVNEFETVAHEMTTILSRPLYLKFISWVQVIEFVARITFTISYINFYTTVSYHIPDFLIRYYCFDFYFDFPHSKKYPVVFELHHPQKSYAS